VRSDGGLSGYRWGSSASESCSTTSAARRAPLPGGRSEESRCVRLAACGNRARHAGPCDPPRTSYGVRVRGPGGRPSGCECPSRRHRPGVAQAGVW
jgi:hypothetical protein